MNQSMDLIMTLAGAGIGLVLLGFVGIFTVYRIIRWAIRDTLNIHPDRGAPQTRQTSSGVGIMLFWTVVVLVGCFAFALTL